MLRTYVYDPLERAAWTFLQTAAVLLTAAYAVARLVGIPWAAIADQAAAAAVLSIATSVLTFAVPQLSARLDLLLRVAKTFLQAFAGAIIAAHITSVVHAPWQAALASAVPIALTAAVKGIAAMALPGTVGASTVPAVDLDDIPPPAGDLAELEPAVGGRPPEPEHLPEHER